MKNRRRLAYAVFAGYFASVQILYYLLLLALVGMRVMSVSSPPLGIAMKTWIIMGSLLTMLATYATIGYVYRLFGCQVR